MTRLEAVRDRHSGRDRRVLRVWSRRRTGSTVQLFLNGGSFGITDPQFGLDVGFYAFDLPFYRFVLNWLFVAVVIALPGEPGHPLHLRRAAAQRPAGRADAGRRASNSRYSPARSCCSRRLRTGSTGTRCCPAVARSRRSPVPVTPTSTRCCRPRLILLAIAIICAMAFFAAIFLRDLRIPAMAVGVAGAVVDPRRRGVPAGRRAVLGRPNAADKERRTSSGTSRPPGRRTGSPTTTVEYAALPGVGDEATRGRAGRRHDDREHPPARPERALAARSPSSSS